MSCSRCGYSACYSYHTCPICNPGQAQKGMSLENMQAQQKAIDSAFESIMKFILALFLHPYFCFVGFWIICTLSLLGLANYTGLSKIWDAHPEWINYLAMGLPVIPAVIFRKWIPKLMKGIFIVLVSAGILWGVIKFILFLKNR